MATHPPKPAPEIVTSDDAPHGRRIEKKWIIIAASVLVLVVLGVLAFLVNDSSDTKTKVVAKEPQLAATAKSSQDLVQTQAAGLAETGDYNGAQKLLDDALDKTSDKVIQGELYENKAIIAENAQKYSDALTSAKKAESLNPTSNSALIIARVSEATGDKKTAASYYLKAADRHAGYDAEEYKQKAAELSK